MCPRCALGALPFASECHTSTPRCVTSAVAPHRLWHSYATESLRPGAALQDVQTPSNTQIRTTQRYDVTDIIWTASQLPADNRTNLTGDEGVARSYTQTTIKELFGEASECAYPDCDEPLIFRDRGNATAVAEIAHIRSETPGGPRHDPNYAGDINGPDNLLLLCGKHHRPVDRHEQAYSIEELEVWKQAQRASAGSGTPVSDADIRSYRGLTAEERQALTDIARRAQRLIASCRAAQEGIDAVRAAAEATRYRQAVSFGPMFERDEDGNESRIGYDRLQLSRVEQDKWDARARAAWEVHRPRALDALATLEEEVAVLHMFAGALAVGGEAVRSAASGVLAVVGDGDALSAAAVQLDGAVARLWQLANGQADPA